MMRFAIYLFCITSLIFVSDGAWAKVRIKESNKYYSVRGKSAATVYKQMAKRGPRIRGLKHVIASTEFNMKIDRVKIKTRGKRCYVKSVRIAVKLKYTYPRWQNLKKASKGDQRRWKAYISEIVRHEKRHGAIAKKYAKDAERIILKASGRTSRKCSGMVARVKRDTNKLKRKYIRDQDAFDRRDHRRNSKVMKLARRFATSS